MFRCFTHRPGKVEGKLNGIRKAFILIALRIRQIEWVLPENGRHHIAVCALRCCVYGGLIVFQADTKPRLAGPNAFPCRRIRLPAAAMSLVIASMLIAKVFQAQFEIAGTVNLWGRKREGECCISINQIKKQFISILFGKKKLKNAAASINLSTWYLAEKELTKKGAEREGKQDETDGI